MGDTVQTAPSTAFDFTPRTRVVLGAGVVARLGELVAERGLRRAFVVSDPGVVAAGHVARATDALRLAGVDCELWAGVHENPSTADVDRCLAAARAYGPDVLVTVGGGSSIDTTKGANFLLTNGGRMEDYWGKGKAKQPMLPLFVVPTTAGTGSEMQSYALIAREEDHQKMACGDVKCTPAVALLDPDLTATQPRRVAACTGLDALTHAVEAAVTRARTPVSSLFARESFRLAHASLPAILAGTADGQTRSDMLLSAAWSGVAIEQSMLGASHSMANPLTAHHDVVHGQAVGSCLPHVIRFNAHDEDAAREYLHLARLAGLVDRDATPTDGAEALAQRVEELLGLAGFPTNLRALGVRDEDVARLAEEAARQWTAQFNPRAATARDFGDLYRAALAGA